MAHSKRNLTADIRSGTSLIEIIRENIDTHADMFAGAYYKSRQRTRKEIIKIVIADLNGELEKL
ncbi:MAG: hypothetical protein V1867_06780 [Candidatus Falkowbacteria bacterium]